MSSKDPADASSKRDPKRREDDHTVIIGSEDPTDGPAPGYSIQPRGELSSPGAVYDETATEEDFIVLLPVKTTIQGRRTSNRPPPRRRRGR